MLQNKLLRVVQAHLLGFSTGSKFSGNTFACSACFIRLFSSSVALSNWSTPIRSRSCRGPSGLIFVIPALTSIQSPWLVLVRVGSDNACAV
jgi:hypothetical protein